MAADSEKIFDFIRKLISGSGPTPSKTAICQALMSSRVVGSMGTAHKYVTAFFAADALRAEFRAPESDSSHLPDRVRSAFEALVSASDTLRNEMVASIDDLVMQSSSTFGKMAAAHSAAQEFEIEELGIELKAMRIEVEALRSQLAEEGQRREAAEATLLEREAALSEATAAVEVLTTSLESELTKTASLNATIEGKTEIIDALQAERATRNSRNEQSDQLMAQLRQQMERLTVDLNGNPTDAGRPDSQAQRGRPSAISTA
jgi:chromosome segregation ATPase